MSSIPIACTLTAPDQMRRQRALQEEVWPGIQEVVRLEDGYALRFPGEGEWVERLSRLMQVERECCPFLTMELVATPEQGPVWFRFRGPEGTREFLGEAFRLCDVDSG